MTQIVLHGILAHKFGRNFMCEVSSVKELISSIDANRNGFHVELYKLAKQGMHYAIIVDGKKLSKLNEISKKLLIKKVHIIPTIVGSGAVAGAIVATMANVALSGALAAGTISFTTYILASVAISVVSLYLQTLLAPKAPEPAAIEASTRAIKESYTFSNKVNIAAQGLKVPVGYGRLLMPSNVIEYSTRNYPLNKRASEIFRYLGSTSPEPRPRPNVFVNIDAPKEYYGWGQNISTTVDGGIILYDPDILKDYRLPRAYVYGTKLMQFYFPSGRWDIYCYQNDGPGLSFSYLEVASNFSSVHRAVQNLTRLDSRVRSVPGGYVYEGLWTRGSPSNGCDLLMDPDFENWPRIPNFEGYGGGTSFSRYKTFTTFLVNSFDDAGLNFETGNKVVAQVSLIVNVRGSAVWHDSSIGWPYGYNWTSVWNQSVNGTTKQCSLGGLSSGPILRFGVNSSGSTLAGGDQEALGYGETFQYR